MSANRAATTWAIDETVASWLAAQGAAVRFV
jgi:hypothetical protein